MRGWIPCIAAISLTACGGDVETGAPLPGEASLRHRPDTFQRSGRCGRDMTLATPCVEGYTWDDERCLCAPVPPRCLSIGQCVEAYRWDETRCACVPDEGAAIGATCGPVVCSAGTECCNASCGICTPPGGVCIQQYCNFRVW
jgi:hypothetical protein